MIVSDRRLAGVIPYRVVFFPSEATVAQATTSLATTRTVRLFHTSVAIEDAPCVIKREDTLTTLIDLSSSIDELRKHIAKATLQGIRYAEKAEDRVVVQSAGNSPEQFLDLFNGFAGMKRSGVAPIAMATLEHYLKLGDLFMAYLDGAPICGHVLLVDRELRRVRLMLSASRRLESPALSRIAGETNKMMHWREICHYREQGFATYDFGGIRNDPNDGITKFKCAFGGTTHREYTYLCAGAPALARLAQAAIRNAQIVFQRRFRRRAEEAMAKA